MRRAFSLIELSIVLVILGLLTGGILSGQALIRASELRSVSTEYTRFITAANSFRGKYFLLPGDMNNAVNVWGDNNSACANASVPDGTPGTCNGNGDGKISIGTSTPNGTSEIWQYWNQLALAGLIEGSYTGVNGPTSGRAEIYGTNSPASKVPNAGWTIRYLEEFNDEDSSSWLVAYRQNVYYYGGVQSTDGMSSKRVLKPEEAWNIDTKADDGLPAQGKFLTRQWSLCSTASGNTDYAAPYNLANGDAVCAFMMRTQ